MQDPYKEGRQQCLEMQRKLAGIIAAAVHVGLISVHEGVCDCIDCMHLVVQSPKNGEPPEISYSDERHAEWPRLIAEQYMHPDLPGAYPDCLNILLHLELSKMVFALYVKGSNHHASQHSHLRGFCMSPSHLTALVKGVCVQARPIRF